MGEKLTKKEKKAIAQPMLGAFDLRIEVLNSKYDLSIPAKEFFDVMEDYSLFYPKIWIEFHPEPPAPNQFIEDVKEAYRECIKPPYFNG